MPDVIEPAASGRATCRGCGRRIAARELRFGESLPNPYTEGEALHWFHLTCAACMRPEKFAAALDALPDEVPERDWLSQTAALGAAHRRLPRLVRAERAASGRARCRSCRQVIGKGEWRLALQMFEEGRANPIGTIHVECAEPYLGTASIIDRIVRLTPGLSDTELAEIEARLATSRPAGATAPTGVADRPKTGAIGLAKTRPAEPPAKKTGGAGGTGR